MDVSSDAAYVMAAKEESELMVIKKACQVSVDLFNKYLKEQVMEIVDADKKVMLETGFYQLLLNLLSNRIDFLLGQTLQVG